MQDEANVNSYLDYINVRFSPHYGGGTIPVQACVLPGSRRKIWNFP